MGEQKSQLIRPEFLPLSLIRALWKQRFILLAIAAVLSIAGVAVVFRLPPLYRATALIVVDSQKVPEKYVTSTVSGDAGDRLNNVTQEILTSKQLLSIISEFHLYERELKKLSQEEVFTLMRERDISIKADKSSGGTRLGSFRVSYVAPNGVVAAGVANRIAGLFIQQNLRNREIHSEDTLEFLDSQLRTAKKTLDELEIAVSQYKLQHNGELPQQEAALLGSLSRLQTELQGNQDALNRAQQTKLSAESALMVAESSVAALSAATQAPVVVNPSPGGGAERVVTVPVPRRRHSDDLRAQIATLRMRYTEEYPDVKRLRAELAETLKREEKEDAEAAAAAEREAKSLKAEANGQQPAAPPPQREVLPPSPDLLLARERRETLRAQLRNANEEIAARTVERKRIVQDIDTLEKRLNNLPVREQQMAALTRDYNISKLNYTNLLDKKIEAARSADLERRQQGERFTLIEPATVPPKPFKPNRIVYSLGACFFGLGVAVALAFGRELKNSTLLGEWELPHGTLILGRVPPIRFNATQPPPPSGKGGNRQPARSRRLAFMTSCLAILLSLVAAVVYAAWKRL
jgi:succinoglycan biosynthesis transport protein ExoP